MSNRREFIVQFGLIGGAAAGVCSSVHAQQTMVLETDPQAVALGYKALASKVDKAKYPKYASGQECNTCSLFSGKPGAAAGGCSLFPGKQVSGKGWCSAWIKKA